MNQSIHHLSLKTLTQSQGACPALWFAIEMNYDRAPGSGVRGDLV